MSRLLASKRKPFWLYRGTGPNVPVFADGREDISV
jgi:hypothetical protein